VQRSAEEWYSYEAEDHASPSGRTRWVRALSRGAWSIRTVTQAHLTCDPDHFHLSTELDAYENDRRIVSHNSHRSFPRDLV
jgi:hypothetical protein